MTSILLKWFHFCVHMHQTFSQRSVGVMSEAETRSRVTKVEQTGLETIMVEQPEKQTTTAEQMEGRTWWQEEPRNRRWQDEAQSTDSTKAHGGNYGGRNQGVVSGPTVSIGAQRSGDTGIAEAGPDDTTWSSGFSSYKHLRWSQGTSQLWGWLSQVEPDNEPRWSWMWSYGNGGPKQSQETYTSWQSWRLEVQRQIQAAWQSQ